MLCIKPGTLRLRLFLNVLCAQETVTLCGVQSILRFRHQSDIRSWRDLVYEA